jgi:hypothetical protein
MSYEAIVCLARDEPEVITVNPIDDKVGDNIQAPAVALSLEDLELNEAILDALRHERMEIDGVLASEEKLTIKEKFERYLTYVLRIIGLSSLYLRVKVFLIR